jgi:hypothetical protein
MECEPMKKLRWNPMGNMVIAFISALLPTGASENETWIFDKDETGSPPRGFVSAVGH